jgi:type I restriction enzyme R subunit
LRYVANRLRVIRQVRYSLSCEKSIDLELFLNGLPVATVELKTDFTQSIGDAIDQYRFDRDQQPKGQGAEPLLSFPNGALVHFAVSNKEVAMVTRLQGKETVFLPFNQGDGGAAGNPVNPQGGHRTAYLWEKVWARESWLEILGRYLIARKDKKKQIESIIFPRFHQLDVTRRIQSAVLGDGAGGKYLVQHSAGSGKRNSIAWTAHFLAELHDADHKKIFDTVLVVSDRTVIDTQLQEALFDFQRQTGVVATIKGSEGSKSKELAAALSGNKKIVVCTIQTFSALHKAMLDLTKQGKRFAVIADEAQSSQTGEAAAKLKSVLSPKELAELKDGGEISMDDVMTEADRAAGITWQGKVKLGDQWQGEPIRVVRVEVDGKQLLLATDLEIEAELIALIYRYRWQIELFFKWLKSILGCRHLMAESPEGVTIQIYSALIAALMLQALTGKRPGKRAMELIQMYLMGYAYLKEVIALLGVEKTAK